MDNTMKEIPGFHGRYFMAGNGDVWSKTNNVQFGNNIQKGKTRKLKITDQGFVNLTNPKNRITKSFNHKKLYNELFPEKKAEL